MRDIKLLSAAMIFLALLGCAEINIKSGYQLSEISGKGVLAIGITADD